MRDWRGERGATPQFGCNVPQFWLQCEVNTGGVTEEGARRGSTVVRLALPVKSRWSGRAGGLAQASVHSSERPGESGVDVAALGGRSAFRGHGDAPAPGTARPESAPVPRRRAPRRSARRPADPDTSTSHGGSPAAAADPQPPVHGQRRCLGSHSEHRGHRRSFEASQLRRITRWPPSCQPPDHSRVIPSSPGVERQARVALL
jgi:hypothetical protein